MNYFFQQTLTQQIVGEYFPQNQDWHNYFQNVRKVFFLKNLDFLLFVKYTAISPVCLTVTKYLYQVKLVL